MAEIAFDTYVPFSTGAGADANQTDWELIAQFGVARKNGVIQPAEAGIAGSLAVSNNSGDVRISAGIAHIRGHVGQSTTNHDHTPTAADGTNARIDRAVVRLDYTNKKIVTDLKEGTPLASPVAPALQRDTTVWEFSLAQVRVAASTGALTITDERSYALGIGDLPPGIVVPAAFQTITPASDVRWLIAAGQQVSRITYAELFAQISTSWGSGNGTTTFNIPDLRGRVLVGMDGLGGFDAGRLDTANTIGLAGGEQYHALNGNETGPHFHGGATSFESTGHTHYPEGGGTHSFVTKVPTFSTLTLATGSTPGASGDAISIEDVTGDENAQHIHAFDTNSSGGGAGHNNMPPYVQGGYLVKAF